MRFLHLALFAVLLSSAACAPGPAPDHPRPVNVALVRRDIAPLIAPDRRIISMGHVTETSAVIYTDPRTGAGPRHEETWVRGASGWQLSRSHDVVASAPQS